MAKRMESMKQDTTKKIVYVYVALNELSEGDMTLLQLLIANGYEVKMRERRSMSDKQIANAKKTKSKDYYLNELKSKEERKEFERIIKEYGYFKAVKWFNNRENKAA